MFYEIACYLFITIHVICDALRDGYCFTLAFGPKNIISGPKHDVVRWIDNADWHWIKNVGRGALVFYGYCLNNLTPLVQLRTVVLSFSFWILWEIIFRLFRFGKLKQP